MLEKNLFKLSLLTSCLLTVATGGVQAQSLKIALASEPTAVDPHYHNATSNIALVSHFFEPLFEFDSQMKLQPKLASSWKNLDDLNWQINLRSDVKFSNGAPFTAKDVIFTLCRVMNNETGVAGGYERVISAIDRVSVQDDHTLIITTKTPNPVFINEFSEIFMVWSGLAQTKNLSFDLANKCGVTGAWPVVNDFNSGKAVIGTGPYLLSSYTKAGAIELARNENYWGSLPEWKHVTFVSIPSSAPRLTGLLSGDYDVIENPAARDAKRIRAQGLNYISVPSLRMIYLQLDVGRAPSPQAQSPKGPNDNPLQDLRVRQALSMAIDRQGIVDKVMDGAATPAYQFLPDGMFGTLAHPPKLVYDPAQAKKLLAEAGYPNGFNLTIHGTNDRYINDAQVLQAIAQYFSRIGVKTSVDALGRSVYFPRRFNREFSVAMGGWAASSGETSNFLSPWLAEPNKELGHGSANYGGFSDPEFNRFFDKAMLTMNDGQRDQLLQQAMTVALRELPYLPIHFENANWATRKGLLLEGRADQRTLASSIKSQ